MLVDKPFAVDAAEAVEMVDACREAGVQLIEGFMYRYDPRHARLRALVADGAIGDLRQINTAFSFPITRNPANVRMSTELAGGALGDLGTYCVSVSRLHMGGEPRRLTARMTDDPEFGVDFDGNAVLEFDQGRAACWRSAFRPRADTFWSWSAPRGPCVSSVTCWLRESGRASKSRRQVEP